VHGLSVVAALLIAVTAARADEPCVVADVGSFVIAEDGLDLLTTERRDLEKGDRLLQLNGRRLGSCADLSAALHDARRHGVLAVVALRRAGALQTVLLTLPVATAVPPGSTPTPSLVLAPTALPLRSDPLRSDPAAVASMYAALQRFSDDIKLPLTAPEPYGRRLDQLRQTYHTLRARDGAVAAVEPIIGYYDAVAAILRYRQPAAAKRAAHQSASSPDELIRTGSAAVVEYTTDGEVGEWLRRYPFLEKSIVGEATQVGPVEWAGWWKPDEAIRLLVEQARRETAALGRAPN
jgi:hypothetical protein